MKQRTQPQRGRLTCNLRDPNRPADLVRAGPPGEDVADIGELLVYDEPGFLDSQPKCARRIDLLGGDFARRRRTGDAENPEALRVAEGVLHFAQFRRALQLQRGITALDGEGQGVAGTDADEALHVGEAADLLAVDGGDDVADLKARPLGGAAGFDLVDARRRARLAEEGEQTGEDDDRQNEIRDRTGGNDGRARADFLVMEAARPLLLSHAGERFGRGRRRGLRFVAEELHIAAERDRGDLPARFMAVVEADEFQRT